MLNLVKPLKAPLEPLPSTVPDISYESHPKAPQCSLPGYILPFFFIVLFCNCTGGTHDIKNLPLLLGENITLVSLIPFSQAKLPLVICSEFFKSSLKSIC